MSREPSPIRVRSSPRSASHSVGPTYARTSSYNQQRRSESSFVKRRAQSNDGARQYSANTNGSRRAHSDGRYRSRSQQNTYFYRPPPPPPPSAPIFRDFGDLSESDQDGTDLESLSDVSLDAPSHSGSETAHDHEAKTEVASSHVGHPRQREQETFDITSTSFTGAEKDFRDVCIDMHAALTPPSSAIHVPVLFRWIHINQSTQDLDAFCANVKQIQGIFETDRGKVVQLLQRIRSRQFEARLRSRRDSAGRMLQPCFLIDPTRNEKMGVGSAYTFLCIPFFRLQKVSTGHTFGKSPAYSTPALLQSRYPSTSTERELQQAVCRLPGNPKHHCFHVPTVWLLTIRDSECTFTKH